MHAGNNKRAHLILDDLFNVVEPTPDQTRLIAKAANAAGDVADSYYYMSYYYLMNGDLKMAREPIGAGLGDARIGPDSAGALQRASRRGARRDAQGSKKHGRRRQRRRQRPSLGRQLNVRCIAAADPCIVPVTGD